MDRLLPSRAVRIAVAGAAAVLAGCSGGKSSGSGATAGPGPDNCPLTGRPAPPGGVPSRPALAVKVDNAGPARPQYGLRPADVVYEEPVEGGLTRFIAIYQCQDAPRIEPVRSGRIIDPQIVEQYGAHPLFAYSGGIDAAVEAIRSSPLVDVGEQRAPAGTYRRDPARAAPHNLYSSTSALYSAGRKEAVLYQAPAPAFAFGPLPGRPVRTPGIRIAFQSSPVTWTWVPARRSWARSYPAGPAAAAGGGTLSAANVVVMTVHLYPSGYVEDPSGVHENLVTLTGSGPVQVLRDGAVVTGTWNRPALADGTRFLDRADRPIPLAAGQTWIELVPTGVPVTPG